MASEREIGTAKLVVENFVSKIFYSKVSSTSNKGTTFAFGVVNKTMVPGFNESVVFIFMSSLKTFVPKYKVSVLNASNEKLLTKGIKQIQIYYNLHN